MKVVVHVGVVINTRSPFHINEGNAVVIPALTWPSTLSLKLL